MPLVKVTDRTLKLLRKIKGFLLQQDGIKKIDDDAIFESAKCFAEKHNIKEEDAEEKK
jgi:hypothetical protein